MHNCLNLAYMVTIKMIIVITMITMLVYYRLGVWPRPKRSRKCQSELIYSAKFVTHCRGWPRTRTRTWSCSLPVPGCNGDKVYQLELEAQSNLKLEREP
jgi:hypothetical protein